MMILDSGLLFWATLYHEQCRLVRHSIKGLLINYIAVSSQQTTRSVSLSIILGPNINLYFWN